LPPRATPIPSCRWKGPLPSGPSGPARSGFAWVTPYDVRVSGVVLLAHRRLAALAAAAIVVLWGGILVIAAVERRLPADSQWIGHVIVHLWTAGTAAVIAGVVFTAWRGGRIPPGVMRPVVGLSGVLAAIAVVTGLLDAVGAYPSLRAFHDAVNAVAAPLGWLLLANLLLVVAGGLVAAVRPGALRGGA
jgi:hypothetical protein